MLDLSWRAFRQRSKRSRGNSAVQTLPRVLCVEDDEDSRELLIAILKQGEPNAWYLVVQYQSCGVRQPIFRDPSQGKAELLRDYKHTCVEWGPADVLSVEDIKRYRHKAA